MYKRFIFLMLFVAAVGCTSAHADKFTGLADVTVVDGEIISFRYEGMEYVVADGLLQLGTTTRWYIDGGVEVLWPEGDPVPAATPTVTGTSNPKVGDVGSKADNFLFTLNGSTNISSIDGIDFQETIFPLPTKMIFHFERGGNDTGTWQAILPDGSLGPPVSFSGAADYADTGVDVNGQNAFGVVFTTDVPAQGVRITASGHDTLSISALGVMPDIATQPNPADGAILEDTWVNLSWSAGNSAVSHDVYLGDDFGAVENATRDSQEFRGNQTTTFYVAGFPGLAYPDGLVPGTTYYWRIDEVNDADPNSPWKGDIWSFSIPTKMAHAPDPPDGAKFVDPDVILSWTAGMGAKLHTVYFGDDYDTVNDAVGGIPQAATTYRPGSLALGITYYWRVDEFDGAETHKGDVWSFSTLPDMPVSDPSLVGWWKLDVGFGTVAIDWSGHENHGALNGPLWVEGYHGGALQLDGMDDSVEFANFVPPMQGTITFWINPASVGPRGRILGGHDAFEVYVENDILANQLFAAGSLPEYLESNATIPLNTWTHVAVTYDGTSHLLQIYLNGVLDGENFKADDVWAGGAFAFGHRADRNQEYYNGLLDDVRIYNVVLTPEGIEQTMRGDTTQAWDPEPANGVITDIDGALPLSWSAGEKAAQHDVYFSTDQDAVAGADASDTTGVYRGRQTATTYAPPEGVEWGGGPYYWRIDEFNTDGTITTGFIWSFTVADFILVDDFESYTDDDAAGEAIWQHWIDGFGVVDNGSQVGYLLPPYAEQAIIHSGGQSMPLRYDNTAGVTHSEATLALTASRDWTRQNVTELSLWFRGLPGSTGSFTEGPVGTFTMTGSGTDIWNNGPEGDRHDEFHFAYKTLTGAGSITAKVVSVQNTNGWAKAGVMMRETLEGGSKHTFACITPANGVASQGRETTGGDSFNTAEGGIAAPRWVKLERDIAGYFTVTHSANGATWQPVTGAIPRNIQMSSNVYIGLAVTAHNANATCQAVFSNVTTTGNVSGQWMNQDIGIVSNAAEPLYVEISNASGAPAVVANNNPAAAQIIDWIEWRVPLQAFADQGINLRNVDKIAIGLGSKGGASAGGSGTMYIDDIRLNRPTP